MAKVQEYDLDINPTKLVRSRGLCKLMTKNEPRVEEESLMVLLVSLQDLWFSNVAYYLTYGEFLVHLSLIEKKNLNLKTSRYVI